MWQHKKRRLARFSTDTVRQIHMLRPRINSTVTDGETMEDIIERRRLAGRSNRTSKPEPQNLKGMINERGL